MDLSVIHQNEAILIPRLEAARLLGIPARLLATLAARSGLCPIKIGRRVLYRLDDLRAFATRGTEPAGPGSGEPV